MRSTWIYVTYKEKFMPHMPPHLDQGFSHWEREKCHVCTGKWVTILRPFHYNMRQFAPAPPPPNDSFLH